MFSDIRYESRKSPGFAVTAILTPALGIGAHAAIFSLDQALQLAQRVRDPQQLVLLEARPAHVWNGHISTEGGDAAACFSYPNV